MGGGSSYLVITEKLMFVEEMKSFFPCDLSDEILHNKSRVIVDEVPTWTRETVEWQ